MYEIIEGEVVRGKVTAATSDVGVEGVRQIDVRHLGRPGVIGCWQVGDVLIDPGPQSSVAALLDALDEPPRAILLTHVHLDHAGSVGALVERWPEVPVHVHERGARHLADPTRLLAGAGSLYGDRMRELWGTVLPVPEKNIRTLAETDDLLGFEAASTPGHASHHVAYLHRSSGWAFCGDVAGVRLAPASYVLPPTPPPDIDLPAWKRSLGLIRDWSPTALAPAHFGAWTDVAPMLDELEARLESWVRLAPETDAGRFGEIVAAEIEEREGAGAVEAYDHAAPLRLLHPGLIRYCSKAAAAKGPAAIVMDPADNVAVALRALRVGEEVVIEGASVGVTEEIPVGHKLARRRIDEGDAVLKYSEAIGIASAPIPVGAHVHVQNVRSARLPG